MYYIVILTNFILVYCDSPVSESERCDNSDKDASAASDVVSRWMMSTGTLGCDLPLR